MQSLSSSGRHIECRLFEATQLEINMSETRNYWLAGAMFGGNDDKLPEFIERGYWYCWEKNAEKTASSGAQGNSVEVQQDRFTKIRPGDRLAIKKIMSIADQKMEIRAIGIIKAVDFDEWRVYVNWLPIISPEFPARIVDLKGVVSSLHGPYQQSDPWIQEIFCA
ncbi:MAG: hypothetical protein AB3X41_02590 [Leptothrix ochracea]|uniref:hypothetical protein n=1 Tax=Leptothrix ochracea TaxID=735331 RepID=UPI0034E2F6D2